MSKKEKKVKSDKIPMAIETKQSWWKCATALVCTAAICASSFVAVGKYADAIKETPVATGNSTAVIADNSGEVPADDGMVAEDTVIADDTATDTVADDTAVADDTSADTADASADTSADTTKAASSSKATTNTNSNDPTSYTKAQIVNYYNNAIKNSVSKKVTITRAETITIICDEISPSSNALKKIVDKILESYAKTTTTKCTFVNGKSSDFDGTSSTFVCPSNLEVAGAKSATITKSGSNYLVTINVVSETTTLTVKPKYNKECASPLDLSTVDLFGVKVTQTDFTYAGTTLKATVKPDGTLLNMEVNMPLSGVGAGKAIGISISGKLHGSFNQKASFTYA